MARSKKLSDTQSPSGKLGEFGSAILQIAEEKGISKDKVIETIEAALSAAYKKDYGKRGQHIRAEFNEVSGEAKFYLIKEVVDETTREFPSPEAAEEKTESAAVTKKAETEKKTGKKKVRKKKRQVRKKLFPLKLLPKNLPHRPARKKSPVIIRKETSFLKKRKN
ncbi:MAG: hypothetical protein NT136_00785 [Candidatus Moranbacteria bacterium]|nr:hypothetical protein [Candidatus Moranbacteria bacterium]